MPRANPEDHVDVIINVTVGDVHAARARTSIPLRTLILDRDETLTSLVKHAVLKVVPTLGLLDVQQLKQRLVGLKEARKEDP